MNSEPASFLKTCLISLGEKRNGPLLILLIAVGLTACKKQEQESPTAAQGTTPAQTSAPAEAASEPPFVPARKTSFNEVTSQLDPGGSVYVYLATDQWLAGLATNIAQLREVVKNLPGGPPKNSEELDRVFDVLTKVIRDSGIQGLTGVGMSAAQVTPELYRAKFVLHHPAGQGDGLVWQMLGGQAHPLAAMDMLPKTCAVAAFGDMDFKGLWKAIESALVDSGVPDLAKGVQQFQREFETKTKVSWKELLESLGGEAGIMLTLDDSRKISLPLGAQPLELPEPGLVVAFKVKNDLLYDQMSQHLKGNPQTVVINEQGLKMCAMQLPIPLPIPLQITVASSGDYFFAATSPELVRSVLAARKGSAPGLAKSPEFAALMKQLPADGNQFFYCGKTFSETMRTVQKQALQASQSNPAAMKFFEKLLRAQQPAFGLTVGRSTPTGWQMTSVGNQDTGGAVVLVPLVGAVAIPAAMLLPALAKAKSRAQSINCMNNMKQIGLAYRTWAIDHGDQFPFNVSSAKGGTMELCARDADGFDRNGFRHLQAMSNELASPKILVCPASGKKPALDFASLGAENVSYQVRSGSDLNGEHPDAVLLHCPIHGHDARCDGSVIQGKGK